MRVFARVPRTIVVLACVSGAGCGDPGEATPSSSVEVPFQITSVYALEQADDGDLVARARYYDALQTFDWTGNAGTIALAPGDAAFADGVHLATETRTETLGVLRVDYSQTIPKGKAAYVFELRRPSETISASIPAPTPLTLTIVDNAAKGGTGVTLSWEPKVAGAKVSITAKTESAGCALFDEGTLTLQPEDDTGAYQWPQAESFRSNDTRTCTFDVTVERRERTIQPARWRKGKLDVPTNGVHAEAVRRTTGRVTLRPARRPT